MMAQEKVSGPYVSRYQCHQEGVKHLTGNRDALRESPFSSHTIVGGGGAWLWMSGPLHRDRSLENGFRLLEPLGWAQS